MNKQKFWKLSYQMLYQCMYKIYDYHIKIIDFSNMILQHDFRQTFTLDLKECHLRSFLWFNKCNKNELDKPQGSDYCKTSTKSVNNTHISGRLLLLRYFFFVKYTKTSCSQHRYVLFTMHFHF